MDISTSATAGSPANPNLQFWDKLYQGRKDGWTNENVNIELFKFHDILTDGKTGLDILVPMCGKTLIMLWFAEKGHRVVGIEWSEIAVKQFFEENGLAYNTKLCKIGGIEMHV